MEATSSTSPREREPRSISLTPTAPRRNPQSTFRAPLNRSAWHGSTSWCVSLCVCVEKNHFKRPHFVFMVNGWHWHHIPYVYRFHMLCGRCNGCHCFTNIIMVCVKDAWVLRWGLRSKPWLPLGVLNSLERDFLGSARAAEMSSYTTICSRLKVSLRDL